MNHNKLSTDELKSLLAKQEDILSRKKFVDRLPDKGEKIRESVKAISSILEARQGPSLIDPAELLGRLTLDGDRDRIRDDINAPEWKGRNMVKKKVDSDDDTDEEEQNIFSVLASRGVPEKITHFKEKPKQRITIEEVADLEEVSPSKYEKRITELEKRTQKKDKFLPNRSLRSTVLPLNSKKVEPAERLQLGKSWREDESNLTPYMPRHKEVTFVPLDEALRLENEQAEKMKELLIRQATSRLGAGPRFHIVDRDLGSSEAMEYRHPKEDSDASDHEEVHDEDGDDRAGTVTFTVTEDE